ncbi:MAG: hypothetical protein AVDCRST_MAG19-116, partial [uncultured Thermomicrobiales bacterium]
DRPRPNAVVDPTPGRGPRRRSTADRPETGCRLGTIAPSPSRGRGGRGV